MRGGQPDAVVTILKPAYAQRPTDDELGKRLAAAYMMTAAFSEALPILDAYLGRHPADADALFAAVLAQYQVARATGADLTAADRAKLLKYARAYKGPQEALFAKYLSSLGVNR